MESNAQPKLNRQLGVLTLTATGICSMLGASVYIVPFMIQRNVVGIGPYVLPAFAVAALPAVFAALAYAILSSAMPRAGGSYLYASRGLNPYLGFIASFSQWFGLSIVIGVIAYVTIPFVRDVFIGFGWKSAGDILENSWVRVPLALGLVWSFVLINIRGAKSYTLTLLPMMFLMFGLGAIVIFSGFSFSEKNFIQALLLKEDRVFVPIDNRHFDISIFFSAAALLFSSFIGFDSIAQAGSEARNPTRNLPRAILLAIFSVGTFYFLFTAAVYHTVPWSFVAQESLVKDISAPGLLSYVLPTGLGIAIIAGAAVALINDLPAMLLSVSRLMFAWASDGIFPSQISNIHNKRKTPHNALILAGTIASIGVLGSHFAGDFFLGIDIMVTSMMVNFLLMCVTVLTISKYNPELSSQISIMKSRKAQLIIGWSGTFLLIGFLAIHTYKDFAGKQTAWYFYSTPIWVIVMTIGSLIFFIRWSQFRKLGIDKNRFKTLPYE